MEGRRHDGLRQRDPLLIALGQGTDEAVPVVDQPAALLTNTTKQHGKHLSIRLRGVRSSHVTLTWDPPWTKDRMSEEAMLELGLL